MQSKLKIQSVGLVKIKLHRTIGKIKTVTIKKECGRCFVSPVEYHAQARLLL